MRPDISSRCTFTVFPLRRRKWWSSWWPILLVLADVNSLVKNCHAFLFLPCGRLMSDLPSCAFWFSFFHSKLRFGMTFLLGASAAQPTNQNCAHSEKENERNSVVFSSPLEVSRLALPPIHVVAFLILQRWSFAFLSIFLIQWECLWFLAFLSMELDSAQTFSLVEKPSD